MLKRALPLFVLTLWLAAAGMAQAHDVQDSAVRAPAAQGTTTQIVNNIHTDLPVIEDARTDPPPVLVHSLRGFLAGALIGTGIGYLAVHENHDAEPWRDVLLGAGVGALSGAGIGLGVGVLDGIQDRRSRVRYVMREMLSGTGLGIVFGGAVGGLVALESDDAEDVAVGASIGAISGALVGVVVGVAEGHWRRPRRDGAQRPSGRLVPGLRLAQDQAGQRFVMPGVSGTF